MTYFCGLRAADLVTISVGEALQVVLETGWERVAVDTGGGRIAVSRRLFSPASEFSRTVLGVQNALRNGRRLSEDGFARAVSVIDACDVMLGVVFEPPLSEYDPRLLIATDWARQFDAVVFDGRWVMSSSLEAVAEITSE